MNNNIEEILTSFLEQAKTNDLTTNHYPNLYNNLKVKVSFGQGVPARIPWISFLGDGQTTSDGIYPVYLLYKKQELFSACIIRISETNAPKLSWELSQKIPTIHDYFLTNFNTVPDRYGYSFVYKAYDLKNSLNWPVIESELNDLLDNYQSLISRSAVLIPAILEAIESNLIQNELNEEEFLFQKAQDKLSEFDGYIPTSSVSIYELYKKFIESKTTYSIFKDSLNKDSMEYELIEIIAQIISYCDLNAADKNILNEYADKEP